MADTTDRIHGETGPVTCGEATMRLLARYGVDTVFGIPGVHTLDFCRGLARGRIRHVQARNEQGAGFMADGYARLSGRPGVALVISGPGVTNALTAVGQAWADSIPVLLLSAETHSRTHGKGWGALHEIPDQRAVTAPLTARSLRAEGPEDVPEMVATAFDVFASQRPRPVHISIPIDVQAMPVADPDAWAPATPTGRPLPSQGCISRAVSLLTAARQPVIMVGGGATGAAMALRRLCEALDAPVVASTAGKGIVPDDHPLSLSATTVRPEVQRWLARADAILAVGTELAETDSFIRKLPLRGQLIRIDLDPAKMHDQYPASVPIVADAEATVSAILEGGSFSPDPARRSERRHEVAALRAAVRANLTSTERRHARLLTALETGLGDDVTYFGDICQLVYTGAFAMNRRRPRTWVYPAGYCTLGCSLPGAIGAGMALPGRRIVCLVGDGGFMFTPQELIVAAEEGLGLPVIIWDNGGLKQIQDDMTARNIDWVGVAGRNPEFVKLAESMGADGLVATALDQVVEETRAGFYKDHPTVIVVREDSDWLA